MAADPDKLPAPTVSASYERAAERLMDAVTAACMAQTSFPQQVEAALRATLGLFAAEPELGRLLTVQPFEGDEAALRCYQHWQGRFGSLLRRAAAGDLAAYAHPDFVAPGLIAGLCWRLSGPLRAGEPGKLEALLPSLVEFVHVCYFGADGNDAASLATPGTR